MESAMLQSVSSQFYRDGNYDHMLDIPMIMDSKLNSFGNNFATYQQVNNDCNQLRDGLLSAFAPSTPVNYQPEPSSMALSKQIDFPHFDTCSFMVTSGYMNDNLVDDQHLSFGMKHPVNAQFRYDIHTTNSRKRSIGERERGLINNKINTDCREWLENKKAFSFQEQWDSQLKEELKGLQTKKVPGRRTPKLSDRITALQKLVSPYGKTDTASVLHEACICIKVLQDQIQKSFGSLSDSYSTSKHLNLQRYEEEQLELRSIGLCLVPISSTQKFTNDAQVAQSRTISQSYVMTQKKLAK